MPKSASVTIGGPSGRRLHREPSTRSPLPAGKIGARGAALLVIDLINPMEFDGGDALFGPAMRAAGRIVELGRRARSAGVPVVYVNDNFDCWHLGFRELVDYIRERDPRGRLLADLLAPDPATDHFVLKPLHSAFFQTGLEVLLQRLDAGTLILTGAATEICVLFTANDAYMRGHRVIVPADCVASEQDRDRVDALRLMQRVLDADVRVSGELDLDSLARGARHAGPH
jgi:nicotinamidase-related amidase